MVDELPGDVDDLRALVDVLVRFLRTDVHDIGNAYWDMGDMPKDATLTIDGTVGISQLELAAIKRRLPMSAQLEHDYCGGMVEHDPHTWSYYGTGGSPMFWCEGRHT